MRNRRNYHRNSYRLSNLFMGTITTLIFFCITVGLIAVFCKSIIPTSSTENNALNFTPTISLSPTTSITVPPTQTITPRPTIATPTPTIPLSTPTISPTISSVSTTPVVYCAFQIEQAPPTFTGNSYIIADFYTKQTLLSYRPELQIYPASTIKLLTAMVGLDLSEPSTSLTLSESVFQNITSDIAGSGVPAGTTYPLEVWLNLLLVRSFGDAANTIAEETAGSIEQFIDKMNQKIKQLGLTNTVVDNAVGLDIGNGFSNIHSTAKDMLTIALEALQYPLIKEIIAKPTYLIPATDTTLEALISNSHPFLSPLESYSSPYFTTIGGKTGTTSAAGNCLITIVKGADTHTYICVYFGGKTRDTMAKEIIDLLEYVIESRTNLN